MKPILYSPTESVFDHNGIGILADAVKCEVTEERNGIFEMEMTYPVSGIHFDGIQRRSILKAKPNPVDDLQLFRVYYISKPMKGVVTVKAQHISYDGSGIPVAPFTASGVVLALEGIPANAVGVCPFTFWTDKTAQGEFKNSLPRSLRACMGGQDESILAHYGGEYAYDNYLIKLYNERGMNRGVSIRYGKNLTDLKQDENCSNVYTAVLPYWANQDGDVVSLDEKIINAPGTYDFERVKIVDFSTDFDGAPTQEQLRARTEKYIADNDIGVPEVSLTVAFEPLENHAGYESIKLLEQVLLCDTVNVEFSKLGVSATAKAVKVVYDVLREKWKKVELGNTRATIADTIVEQKKELEKKPSVSQMQNMVTAFTSSILGAKGGAVRFFDTDGDGQIDEMYVADNVDPTQAVNVWRFNYEGLAASKNGYNGPFVLGMSLENGVLSEFMTACYLNANMITAGVLQSQNGSFSLNLDTGELSISGYATKEDLDNVGGGEEFDSLNERVEDTKTQLDSLQSGVETNANDISAVRDSVMNMQLQNDSLNLLINKIAPNGVVTEVVTTTGYRFDADGMKVAKSGEELSSRTTHDGFYVDRTDENVLTANADGVNTLNLKVRKYLVVGEHLRVENYNDGEDEKRTAFFWLPGN